MPPRRRYVAITHEGITQVHAYGGDPAALCGLAGDGDEDGGTVVDLPPHPKIDCVDCQQIWRAWKRFTQRDFTPGA